MKYFNFSQSKYFFGTAILCSIAVMTAMVPPGLTQTTVPQYVNLLSQATPNVLPEEVGRKLIEQVSKDTRITKSQLKITEIKPADFDGCLGIFRPNQLCTKILIQGWQAIITGPNSTFVYHLSQDASRIAQNDTASGAKIAVRVSFELFGGIENIPKLEPDVILKSTVSGDFTGRTTTVTLTSDGNITQFTIAPNIRSRPVVVKTLTPQQVEQFKKVLENRRFPNFNGLSYLTSAAVADFPTTTYQSQDTVTHYISLEQNSMPRSLQQVINAWEKIIAM